MHIWAASKGEGVKNLRRQKDVTKLTANLFLLSMCDRGEVVEKEEKENK